MDFNRLEILVGKDKAILIYDHFVGYSTDILVQLVLDGFTEEQLKAMGKLFLLELEEK